MHMAGADKHEKPRMRQSDRRAFFLCNELDCGFFYDSTAKRVARESEIEVFVVVLGKKLKLKPVGRGDAGYQELANQGMDNCIFPVNLFQRPFQIDVKVSRTVTPELHERWLKLIAYYKNEPFVSERKEYVRVRDDNGKIVQHRLCTAEEFQKVLESEAEWRTKQPGEWQPGQWRLATQEEKTLS
jgi:hypothetical protein